MSTDHSKSPLLFLSHAGLDTAAARKLKQRIENAPDALACGLKVWFDKDDLVGGRPWQEQLEKILEKDATAFAVFIGTHGVVNWVDAEVRLALSRAISEKGRFPIIPILAKDSRTFSSGSGLSTLSSWTCPPVKSIP